MPRTNTTRHALLNSNADSSTKAKSIRGMKASVWSALRKLAILNDMTLPQYIEHLVEKESKNVQVSIKG